jgi:hypothetical protein
MPFWTFFQFSQRAKRWALRYRYCQRKEKNKRPEWSKRMEKSLFAATCLQRMFFQQGTSRIKRIISSWSTATPGHASVPPLPSSRGPWPARPAITRQYNDQKM